jgi:hypothetical protein
VSLGIGGLGQPFRAFRIILLHALAHDIHDPEHRFSGMIPLLGGLLGQLERLHRIARLATFAEQFRGRVLRLAATRVTLAIACRARGDFVGPRRPPALWSFALGPAKVAPKLAIADRHQGVGSDRTDLFVLVVEHRGREPGTESRPAVLP